MTTKQRMILMTMLMGSCLGCDSVVAEGTMAPDREPRPLPLPSQPPQAKQPSLLEAATLDHAVDALTRKITGGNPDVKVLVLELRASAESLLVQVQDPKTPERVLQFEYSGGKLQEPLAVELRGAGDLEQNLFPLDSVYLKGIPRLCGIAVEHVDPQDGKVDHIVLRRNFPFSHDVRFRVFVNSPRRAGQIDANRFGHPLLG